MPHVDRTEYELAALAWMVSVLPAGYVVIFEDADGVRPDQSYATLKVNTLARTGTANNIVKDQVSGAQFQGLLQVHYRGTLSANLFARDARSMLERLRVSIALPSVQESTHADGLFVSDSSDAIDLTELQGVGSVPRFQSDFFFNWSTVTGYEAEVIETVTVTKV